MNTEVKRCTLKNYKYTKLAHTSHWYPLKCDANNCSADQFQYCLSPWYMKLKLSFPL